jgi:hypothetical protein
VELSERAGSRVRGERPASRMEPSVWKRGVRHAAARQRGAGSPRDERRLQSLVRCTELLTRTAGAETAEEVQP